LISTARYRQWIGKPRGAETPNAKPEFSCNTGLWLASGSRLDAEYVDSFDYRERYRNEKEEEESNEEKGKRNCRNHNVTSEWFHYTIL
jgi:hypothetical protein